MRHAFDLAKAVQPPAPPQRPSGLASLLARIAP